MSKKNANPKWFRDTISGEVLLELRANLEMLAQDILECKFFHLLLSWVLDLEQRKHKQELEYPDDPKNYDSKLWSYLCVMPGITVSDYASNRVYYFVIIYLASKLTEPQAVGKDELFHNHAQLSVILEAAQTKPDERLHRITEQTGDIFEAIAGICQRGTRASARFLRELSIHNDDADVLHEKLLALASRMGFLLNAADISAKEVCVLLNIPFSPEGRMY